jgi:hypothetical protein
MATLEPDRREINGGEHHSVTLDLDSDGFLKLQIVGMCYGTHAYDFDMHLPAIGPDELDNFAKQVTQLAEAMRVIDRTRD